MVIFMLRYFPRPPSSLERALLTTPSCRFFSAAFPPHCRQPRTGHHTGPLYRLPRNKRNFTDYHQQAQHKMASQDANAELVESAKRSASYQAVKDHFNTSMKAVGIGSGSTIKYVVDAIKEEVEKAGKPQILFVPTGFGSRKLVTDAGLMPLNFESLPQDQGLDVAFDGTDECDEDFNLIKGGGACLFQEKLVASRAKKFVAVADFRKDAKQLLTQWTYIPIEVAPMAVNSVLASLKALGSPNPSQRFVKVAEKQTPLKTDQDFFIVMAPFAPMRIKSDASSSSEGKTSDGLAAKVYDPLTLSDEIKKIVGVLEVGLFVGETGPEALKKGRQGGQKPIAVYFGMQDGSVKVRNNPAGNA